jgi:hypothetical protein
VVFNPNDNSMCLFTPSSVRGGLVIVVSAIIIFFIEQLVNLEASNYHDPDFRPVNLSFFLVKKKYISESDAAQVKAIAKQYELELVCVGVFLASHCVRLPIVPPMCSHPRIPTQR